jgi:hypothetical protein
VLIRQTTDAVNALRKAMKALEKAAPNGRDYYLQGDEAVQQATKEHNLRMSSVAEILEEMRELQMHVYDHAEDV